ncbi:arginine repressor [Mariniphaga sediminis]|jgi:transcriptional regulator of arginine metabolism|uniref:Arginine repressor n=1 Tax=Mariniphaga sediminis TaxID=1628158 RepID=A0A399D4E1_9BACT|nr:arginine repressor [Mariniphaga sediminis]RIH66785.1 arginine repressor [Mariniphaga sediminis]
MKNRVQRQLEIRRIIAKGNVRSQEEMLAALKKRGFDLTQATLSRDLKFLQVAKVPHPVNGYVYLIPNDGQDDVRPIRSKDNFLADGFQGLNFSGNLAVMKTLPGYASTIAAVIDSARQWEILGTIAGDDTVLIIRREGTTSNDLMNALISIIPKLKNKL